MSPPEQTLANALDRMITVFELSHDEMLNFELEAIAEAKTALADFEEQRDLEKNRVNY